MIYKKDDILVSLEDTAGGRLKGDIIIMTSDTGYYYGKSNDYMSFSYSNLKKLRFASNDEIIAYKRGIRNIKELTQPQLPIFN